MDDRERLEAIVKVVRQYLPPDGISIKEAMGKIIELVDPLPPKREWVGITDEEIEDLEFASVDREYGHLDVRVLSKAIESTLKQKNT